ncbi:uncharacterized protein LOC120139259 [Hibiscus syriacus]|uniref:uncharacterized protein LOC120139259 n=1 Tax=Hibiscus syriacus TaxID=106335 RepID=UPI001920C83B|nr:uncharacterized protein LOC120139259 [Hibiscus syriacus]
MERKMIDATSGGAIVNKTHHNARELIPIMAANSQQFGFRQDTSSRRVNEVGSSFIEHQLSHLTSLAQQLVIGKTQQVKACGICVAIGNPIDMCPTLQDDSHEYANAVGRFSDPPQRKYDPYLNTYNPGCRDHPNLSYGPRPSAITLRSGKELKEPSPLAHGKALEEENEKEVVAPQTQKDQPKGLKSEKLKEFVIDTPFPSRFTKSKKEAEEKEILETFHKIEVNISLLDTIKQVPRYAKVLKELCTNKRKLKGNEKVSMGENVSAILQKKTTPQVQRSRSNVYPEGVLEDVLVQVNELVVGVLVLSFGGVIVEEEDRESGAVESETKKSRENGKRLSG